MILWFSGDGSGYTSGSNAGSILEYGTPIHIIMTDDGTTARLYANGELIDTQASVGIGDISSGISLGRNNSGGDGIEQMDDVRIYQNDILTESQAKAIYNQGLGTEDSPVYYNDGYQFDKTFHFDGTTNIQSDNVITGYPFTLSCYINAEDTTGERMVLGLIDISASNVYYEIGISNGQTYLYPRNGTPTPSLGSALNTGTWYHILAEFISDTEKKLYLNNVLDITNTDNVTFNSNVDKVLIGQLRTVSPTGYFEGLITDPRVYNRILTADEKTSLYNNGLALTSNTIIEEIGDGEDRVLSDEISGLLGWWKLDGDTIDYANDVGDRNNGTWSGTELYGVGKRLIVTGKQKFGLM